MPDVVYRGTQQEFVQHLYRVGACLAGHEQDSTGAVDALKNAMGLALLGSVQTNFVRLSEGGTSDIDGQPWPPLSPITLALRRVGRGGKARARLEERIAKLPRERRQRMKESEKRLQQMLGGTTPDGRRQRRQALSLLRRKNRAGGVTGSEFRRLEKLLSGKATRRQVEEVAFSAAAGLILRDRGDLLLSLTPGVGGSDQVNESGPGFIRVGSRNRVGIYHNSSKPRKLKRDGTPRLPRRQFIPEDGDPLPPPWGQEMADALSTGISSDQFWRRFLGSQVA